MKPLLALFAFFLVAAAAPLRQEGIRICDPACRPIADLTEVPLTGRETVLKRTIRVDPAAMPLARTPMVLLVAMASSEVRWNATVIGRNGVPGRNRAAERPGRFIATFMVPARLVRPGANEVSVRMSAHHLWLPVRRPVHQLEILPYGTDPLPGLAYYLPALLTLGALLGAGIYFASAASSDRRNRGALLLAGIALCATLQLLIEVSRAFIAYTYPWHLARVSAIALLAAATVTLIAAYASSRLVPGRGRLVVAATALLSLASLLFVPWYDLKALGAMLAGALALAACGAGGWGRNRSEAAGALAAAAAILALMAHELTLFLDRSWFIILALLLVLLAARQVGALKRARHERDVERALSAALAERLSRAERSGEPIVSLKDGSRTHRVGESDIIFVRAADDYCEVALADGRTLLATSGLARLLEALPPRIVRVHKSYAVNRSHVLSVATRPGGGRLLMLSNGESIPVGRSYGVSALG